MKIYLHAEKYFHDFHYSAKMSQEFDIHRELWDYCDEYSRRIITPPPQTAPTPDQKTCIFENIENIIALIDDIDNEEEQKKKEVKVDEKVSNLENIPLDTPDNIFLYMCEATKTVSHVT